LQARRSFSGSTERGAPLNGDDGLFGFLLSGEHLLDQSAPLLEENG
jgi:hypothetical protein